MRAVIQRVLSSTVTVAGELAGEIGPGLMVLLGVGAGDTAQDAVYLAEKIVNLRIFNDTEGKLNCSALDLGLSIMVVSQFTLYGDCRKGRRPNFTGAAPPEAGEELYEVFCNEVAKYRINIAKGRFRSHMEVGLINDGPVTIILDSQRQF